MLVGSGRFEKRLRLAVPVEISSLHDPRLSEQATTENVGSTGIRVITTHARALNELVVVSSLLGGLRTLARVVYCQRLADGRFGVGVQFQGVTVYWPKDAAADLQRQLPGFPWRRSLDG